MNTVLLWTILSLQSVASAPSCFAVEISAVGRAAHGASVMRHSAPHRLVRALDRLPRWTEAAAGRRARIVALEAAPSVNVIPPRATAVVELIGTPPMEEELLAQLQGTLGTAVRVAPSDRPCAPPDRSRDDAD